MPGRALSPLVCWKSAVRALCLAAALLVLAGCHWILPFPQAAGDSAGTTDLPGGLDPGSWSPETSVGDGPRDGSPAEARLTDAPVKREVKPGPPDIKPEPPDVKAATGDVLPPTGPCAAAAYPMTSPWPATTMRLCGTATTVTQCTAETLCNTAEGWHLCSPLEYQARGGGNKGPGASYHVAWLKGCVRDSSTGPTPYAPINKVCSTACPIGVTSANLATSWPCSGGGSGNLTIAQNLGLLTSGLCKRAGVDTAAAEGYWAPVSDSYKAHEAVCCQ